MKLSKKFNTLSVSEYRDVIKHHKRYTNFNPLGLYRSLIENPKLDTDAQLDILALANEHFGKFYEFLLVKDINLYAKLSRLGKMPLTITQEWQYREQLRQKAQMLLKQKQIRRWRVGIYTTSERWAGIDEATGDIKVATIMTKESTYKNTHSPTKVPHIHARKHKKTQIRQALNELWDE